MTPEQEVLSDLLRAAVAVTISARETIALAGEPPVDDAAFAAMSPIQRIATTALIKQFEQLESLLNGVFRATLRALGVRLKGLYPPDIANRMADLDVLDQPERWVAIVKLRNELVHEYPLGAGDRYERLAAAIAAFPFLFDAAERAGTVIHDRRLLPEQP